MKVTRAHKLILLLSIIFFIIYSYLSFSSPARYVSPDETVNSFFTTMYSQTGELSYTEDLNEIAQGIIHPRSALYLDGKIVDQKYLGFPVVNGTMSIVVPEIIRFFTPIMAILGAVYLYLLTRDIFNKRIALFSFMLALLLPPLWYWSSLALFENVAGCAVFIIALRYFFKALDTNGPQHFFLWGLFLGLALFIRAEYILLCIPFAIVALWTIKKLKKRYIVLTAVSFLIALGPFFLLNNELYGSPLLTGTHIRYGIEEPISMSSFSVGNIFTNLSNLTLLTPVLFLCGFLGSLYCFKKGLNRRYIWVFVLSAISITTYFLSGRVLSSDVHSSYVRYLLPVYLLSLPLLSYFLLSFKSKYIGILITIAIVVTSVAIVVPKVNDNLMVCKRYAGLSSRVASVTEPDAIIFLDYWDKAIFPERKVGLVAELPEENRSEILCNILVQLDARDVPVYLLAEAEFKKVVDYESLVQELSARGYVLSQTGYGSLYEIEKLEGSQK
jgi:hypothetical protein